MRSFDRDLKTACSETGGARQAHTLSFGAAAPWRRCPSAGAALSLSPTLRFELCAAARVALHPADAFRTCSVFLGTFVAGLNYENHTKCPYTHNPKHSFVFSPSIVRSRCWPQWRGVIALLRAAHC